MAALHPERGQASVELVALVPLLILLAAFAAQLLAVGYTLWSAAEAARAGARAAYVGADPERVAARAVPTVLEPLRVREAGAAIEVSLPVPRLLPMLPRIPVTAAAGLDPGARQ